VPGEHNILNGLAAFKTARVLGIDDNVSFSALSQYQGAWRRMEETKLPDFVLIDDYAHHPTEIKATLKAIREKYPRQKIYCVFQPHQYQRTKLLFNDFVLAFKEAISQKLVDKLMFIDVYDVKGREGSEEDKKYNSEMLAKAVSAQYIEEKLLKKK